VLRKLRSAATSPTTALRTLDARIRRQLGIPRRWVHGELAAHPLVVRDGTIRRDADYDDAWLYASLRHAKHVIDVGANIGQSALLALVCPNVERVVLVEANWQALSVAAENIIRNHFAPRAQFIEAFASDVSDATVDFWTVGTGAAGSMFAGHAVSAARSKNNVVQVPTVTLDDIVSRLALDPDLIKIDVEGAEWPVLQGFADLLPTLSPRTELLVEVSAMALRDHGVSVERLLSTFRAAGFRALAIANPYDVDTYLSPSVAPPAPLMDSGFDQMDLLFRRA